MGSVKIKLPTELSKKLENLSKDTTGIAKAAVYEGAKIIADEAKARLEGNLIGSTDTTGDLVESFGITPIKVDENGNVNAKIGFSGYDRKGVPNQLKARAFESGTSKQKAKPFMRPAVRAVEKKAKGRMADTVKSGINKIMEG